MADSPAAAPTQSPAQAAHGRGARRALMLLLGINLFNYIDRYILAAVEPHISREFFPGGSERADIWMGLLPTAFMVCYMLTAPVFGWLADRMRRWAIIGIGVILWSLASGASGLAGGIVVLLITRIFVGIGEGAYGPSAPTIIADLYPVSRRGRMLAWFYLAIPVGSALGFVLGGQITALSHSWRTPFYAVVPPGLLLGVLCFFMPEPPRGQSDSVDSGRRVAKLADIKVLLHTPSYVLNTLGMTASTFAVGGLGFWMARYVGVFRMHADPLTAAGQEVLKHVTTTFGAITVVAGLVGTTLGGIIGDRLRPRMPGSYFVVSGIAILLGLPFLLLAMTQPFPLAWAFIFLAELCLFFGTGPTNAILANVTHPSIRASAFALTILTIHLFGDAASPFLMPLVRYLVGGRTLPIIGGDWNIAFGLVALAFLAAGIFWLLGAKHLQRDTELAPTRL